MSDGAAAPPGAEAAPPVAGDDAIVDAFLAELAGAGWQGTTLPAVAARAGLSLSALYPRFGSKAALVAAWLRRTDRAMLDFSEADLAGQAPRERLFDILMRRFDALAPHRLAVREIGRAALRDPALALVMRGGLLRAMRWAVTAAGLEAAGWRGALLVRGVGQAYLRTLQVWHTDDDQGSRTMAELDRRLVRLNRFLKGQKGEGDAGDNVSGAA